MEAQQMDWADAVEFLEFLENTRIESAPLGPED
jgi:hypothetical protein